jgi:hypothetical protein
LQIRHLPGADGDGDGGHSDEAEVDVDVGESEEDVEEDDIGEEGVIVGDIGGEIVTLSEDTDL